MSLARIVLLAVMACWPLLEQASASPAAAAQPTACDLRRHDIAIGGVIGFSALANPANTHLLRETCRVRLYIHDYIWRPHSDHEGIGIDQAKSILQLFGSVVPVDVELHETSSPVGWFRDVFQKFYAAEGVKASVAHVNMDESFLDEGMAIWTRYVDEARRHGLGIVAPIFSPNSNQWKDNGFSLPQWNTLRSIAQYGGGLTIDSPPRFFLHQPRGYKQFVIDEIRWANSLYIHSTVIISPSTNGDFLADTQKTIAILVQSGAVPSEYVVENYDPTVGEAYPNSIGQETDPQTVTGVALWIAQHCSTTN